MIAIVEAVDLARAGAGPEAGYAVVGAGGEDVAYRVPVEGPYGVFVCMLEAVGGVDGLSGSVDGVGGVVGGDSGCGAWRIVGFVEEEVVDGAVIAAG